MVIRRRSLVFGLSLAAILTALLVLGSGWGAGSAKAQEGVTSLALDMDPTNGSGPCNPVDGTHGINVGDTYQVAICLTNAPGAPSAFQFEVIYSDDLDQCVPTECAGEGCLDGSPDANAGTTTWGGTALGADWDCNVMNAATPTCDVDPGTGTGHGEAFLQCLTLSEEPTLSVGSGVSTPIAMLTFKSIAKGTDTMKLENVEVDDAKLDKMVLFFGESTVNPVGTVAGGTVSTEGTFPTSTASPSGTTPAGTAPANATPGGDGTGPAATAAAATAVAQGTPLIAIDQAATATYAAVATKAASGTTTTPGGKATPKHGAASEEGGSSGPNAALIGGIVIGCVIVIGGMGWFAYRRLLVR
jgi:hypothetical protein